MRVRALWSLAAAAAIVAPGAPAPAANEEVKPTVRFAETWDAAVEEAKLLNVPMVVHSHGFF
jgi:hypothetical protein